MRPVFISSLDPPVLHRPAKMLLTLLIITLEVLCQLTRIRADEVLVNVKDSVIKEDGSDYDVTVEFDIFRQVQPAQTLYFDIGLEEDDTPGFDEIVAHHYECIAPNQWVPHGALGFKAHIKHLFDNIPQSLGDDYQKQEGEDVDEFPCPEAIGDVRGNGVMVDGVGWVYTYEVFNDPGLIAMNPNIRVIGLTVSAHFFPMDPPLARGQATRVSYQDPRPPPLDDDGGGTELAAVPFLLHFSNGDILHGVTFGPMASLPRLQLERPAPAAIRLSWNDPRFTLQATTQLGGDAPWFSLPQPSPATVPINGSRFFRLAYP